MNDSPLVSIKCTVYNQEPYLRQCLDGFVMQKTNFPFEAIVHDDASTDKSADIIREYAEKYPDIIKPIYETENQYSKHDGSLDRIIDKQIRGKYIAYCEGDDYWIDPYKLQKQVDYMEEHPECGLIHTQVKQYNQNERLLKSQISGFDSSDFDHLIIQNTIVTLTTLFRSDLYFQYRNEIKPEKKNWKMADMPMWLYYSHESKVHFIPEVTGVYRILQESAYHSSNVEKMISMSLSSYDICKFYIDKYKKGYLLPAVKAKHVSSMIYKYITHNKPVDRKTCHKIGRIRDCSLKMILYYLLSQNRITCNILYKHLLGI